MRRFAPATALLCVLALPASATAAAGGAAYVAPGQGGSSYGSPDVGRLVVSPVLRSLAVAPRQVAWNRVPQMRVRIDRDAGGRVRASVRFTPLTRSAVRRTVAVGRIATGRTVRVRLPAGLRLRAGRYAVSLVARAADGRSLRRGRSVPLVVRAKPRPRPVAAPSRPSPPPPALPSPSPSPSGVFPIAGPWTWGAPFGEDRGTHRHQGQDLSGAQGTPVVAPLAGTVAHTSFQAGGAGEYVVLDTPSYDFMFAHCVRRSTAVRVGQAVGAGARLCLLGSTGRSSGPHLHFEAWVGGPWQRGGRAIDPKPLLRRWAR